MKTTSSKRGPKSGLDHAIVKRAFAETENLSSVARIFGVSRQRIHQIVRYGK